MEAISFLISGGAKSRKLTKRVLSVALLGGALLAVEATSEISYLLFHSLAELFSVTIAFGIFIVSWNSRRIAASSFLLSLGIAYFFVGAFDLAHTLTYSGMGVVPIAGANLPTQLWLSGRLMEGAGLVAAPLLLRRRVSPVLLWLIGTGLAVLLLVALLTGVFPAAFVEGQGLTAFKRGFEYVLVLVLLVAVFFLWLRRKLLDREVLVWIIASIFMTVAAELVFTLYEDPYGGFNQLGHLLKIVSFALIYKATLETGLRRPYALLFRELKQNEVALEQANRELDAYASSVSHDLRGPLSAISNANEVIRHIAGDCPDGHRLRDVSEIIARSVDTSSRLVHDLLELARAGQNGAALEEVGLDEVLEQVRAQNQARLDELGGRLDLKGELGTVKAARAHIFQLFSNLVANSLRHAAQPGLVIGVERLPTRNGGRHRFCVRDNGPGVPSDSFEKIFSPFYRGTAGGTGIGLAIVQKIAVLYQGDVTVRNEGGAVFEVTLADPSDERQVAS